MPSAVFLRTPCPDFAADEPTEVFERPSLNAVPPVRDQLSTLPDASGHLPVRRNSRTSYLEHGADTGANFALRNDLESLVPFPAI